MARIEARNSPVNAARAIHWTQFRTMSASAASIDPAEIARFAKMAADWWSPDGPMKALHWLNPVRVTWLRDRIAAHFPADDGSLRDIDAPPVLKGLRILDIGCGAGILSEPLTRLGATVTGLDPAPGNIEMARLHAEDGGLAIDYRKDSAETLAAAGERFDAVCAMEVVEHVRDPAAFIATAAQLVRPGGLLFVSTLNRTLKSFALAIVGAEYVLRWVPPGTHQWEKFLTPKELEEMIAATGLRMLDESGVVFNPLTREWRTSSDMDVNYMMAAMKP